MNTLSRGIDVSAEFRRAGLETLAQLAADAAKGGTSPRLTQWLRRARELQNSAEGTALSGDEVALLANLARSLTIAAQLVSGIPATERRPQGSPLESRRRS